MAKQKEKTLSMDEVREIIRNTKIQLLDEILVSLDKRRTIVEGEFNKAAGGIATCNDLSKLTSQLSASMDNEDVTTFAESLTQKIQIIKTKTTQAHFIHKGKAEILGALFDDIERNLNQIIALPNRKKVGFGKNKEKNIKDGEK